MSLNPQTGLPQATPQPRIAFCGLGEYKGIPRIMLSGLPPELAKQVAMYDMFKRQHGVTEGECKALIRKVGGETEQGLFLRNCLMKLQMGSSA